MAFDMLADDTMRTAALVNLDLAANEREAARAAVAERLRLFADMPALPTGGDDLLRVVMANAAVVGDDPAYLRLLADRLSPRSDEVGIVDVLKRMATGRLGPLLGDKESVEAFKRMTNGDPTAVVSSDVDGLKGDFTVRGGRVVRLVGGSTVPYLEGASGMRRIENDGAYSVEWPS